MDALSRAAAALAALALVAGPALGQEDAADSAAAGDAAADSAAAVATVADSASAAAADSAALAADSLAIAADAAGAPAPDVARVVPSLEGLTKVAVTFRDMVRTTPGAETQVEIWRGSPGQVLRFVTGGTVWAIVVRPPGGSGAYTLRDPDCAGDFDEDVEAGTPLEVPDCAAGAPSGAP